MCDILCITNRSLCKEDFLRRIEKIASANPKGIVLREKDLTEKEYKYLATKVIEICNRYNTPCLLHNFTKVALELKHPYVHLPLNILENITAEDRKKFKVLGASCHSVDDAVRAEKLGCTYITAGHIFDTDCKKGLPGRGLDFLKNVCESVKIPVYAIGGISSENIKAVKSAGAKGACVMSSVMMCEDVEEYLGEFR
ncbi:MAG: thiamine phosphate synthase [Oscillospiraceae bacterium]|nr:thiamine phosphate synthase [Oscillospiraceae bacterium]